MKVVLDTNVYISAFTHPAGTPFTLWCAAVGRQYQLLISPAIVSELGHTLRATFCWDEPKLRTYLRLLTRVAEIVTPRITLDAVPSDPSDNRILECAVEGRANLIVSGDRHLRRLRVYEGIPILRPADLLRTLGAT